MSSGMSLPVADPQRGRTGRASHQRGPAAAAELYRKEETLHVRAGECEAADFDGPEEACKLSIPRGMGGPGHAGRSFTRAMCAVAF